MSQCQVGTATGFLSLSSQVCGRVTAHPSSQSSYHTSSESQLGCGVVDPRHTDLVCNLQGWEPSTSGVLLSFMGKCSQVPYEGSTPRWDSPVLLFSKQESLQTGTEEICRPYSVRTNLRLRWVCNCQSFFWGLAHRGDWAFLPYRQFVLVN